ncbi:hypothetical protein F4604DRAFT_1933758 [Suillus subluteus]|nr:hypothetical protein F4604DRAFT_1933758 [Suillus subluteus]
MSMHDSQIMQDIGHMANAMNKFHKPLQATSFDPPPIGPSTQGHLFGHLPTSWLPPLSQNPSSAPPADQSVSAVGRKWTTAWDHSKGLKITGPEHPSVQVVWASSEPAQSRSSPMSSLPSSGSSHN